MLLWLCSGEAFPITYTQDAYLIHSAGLVCFCYASQNQVVARVVLLLTAFCTFGLGAVSLWFVAERWAYNQHQGARWLADVLEENWQSLWQVPGLKHVALVWGKLKSVALQLIRSTFGAGCIHTSGGTADAESLPTTSPEVDMMTRTPSQDLLRHDPTFKNTKKHSDTVTAKPRIVGVMSTVVRAMSRIHALRPHLKKLENTHTMDAHRALVR